MSTLLGVFILPGLNNPELHALRLENSESFSDFWIRRSGDPSREGSHVIPPKLTGKLGPNSSGKLKRCPIFWGGYVILPRVWYSTFHERALFVLLGFLSFAYFAAGQCFLHLPFGGIYIYNGLNLLIHNAQVYHQSLPALEEDSFGGRTGASKGKPHAGLHWSV